MTHETKMRVYFGVVGAAMGVALAPKIVDGLLVAIRTAQKVTEKLVKEVL